MNFYLSRNTENHGGGYKLSNYPPQRDPREDAFHTNGGQILGQFEVGSWFYWGKSGVGFYSETISTREVEKLKDPVPFDLDPGYCINLTTMEKFCLTEAESYENWEIDNTEKKISQNELNPAIKEFLAFGHPREGSNRYHKAWEQLNAIFSKEIIQ